MRDPSDGVGRPQFLLHVGRLPTVLGLSARVLGGAVLSRLLRCQLPELGGLSPSVPVADPALWVQGGRTNQPKLAVFLPIMFDNAEPVKPP